jgi:hypothetical protein
VLSRYIGHFGVPHDAIVVVASVGAPLQIDAVLRIKSKNGSTFHIICSVTPHDSRTTITSCGVTMTMISNVARRNKQKFAAVATITDHSFIKCNKRIRSFFNLKGLSPLN